MAMTKTEPQPTLRLVVVPDPLPALEAADTAIQCLEVHNG
jgi:hypothetical protein